MSRETILTLELNLLLGKLRATNITRRLINNSSLIKGNRMLLGYIREAAVAGDVSRRYNRSSQSLCRFREIWHATR